MYGTKKELELNVKWLEEEINKLVMTKNQWDKIKMHIDNVKSYVERHIDEDEE